MKYEIILVETGKIFDTFPTGAAAAKYLEANKYYFINHKARIVARPETVIEQLKDKKYLCIPLNEKLDARIRIDTPDEVFIEKDAALCSMPIDEWIKKNKNIIIESSVVADSCHVLWKGVNIEFAKTAEEIIWVYLFGPSSCTRDSATKRGLDKKNQHPLATLGNSDIQVAYVKSKDEKWVIYRSLVRQDKMIYDHGYTDHNQIVGEAGPAALRTLGFSANGTKFKGARIERIPLVENKTRFLCPALDVIYDNDYILSDDGKSLFVGKLPNMEHLRANTLKGYAYSY